MVAEHAMNVEEMIPIRKKRKRAIPLRRKNQTMETGSIKPATDAAAAAAPAASTNHRPGTEEEGSNASFG
jgi:hypothetical protein